MDSILKVDNYSSDYTLCFWSKQKVFSSFNSNYVNQQVLQINSKRNQSTLITPTWLNFGVGFIEYSSYKGSSKTRLSGKLPEDFDNNKWHFFAYTFNRKDSVTTIYIDSTLITSKKINPFEYIKDSSLQMFIGYGYQDALGYEEFSNYYDDVIIYDRILNKLELNSIINRKKVVTKIEEVKTENKEYILYPNPTSSYINLKDIQGYTNFEILNIYGAKKKYGKLNDTQISIEELNSGTYIIYLFNKMSKFNQFKLVKN